MATSTEKENVAEHAVGISAYSAPNAPGFTCTIKHRYTDFLVNEILPDGQVVHLTDLNAKRTKGAQTHGDGNNLEVASNGDAQASTPDAHGTTKRKGPDTDEPLLDSLSAPRKKPKTEETQVESSVKPEQVTKGDSTAAAPGPKEGPVSSLPDADKKTLEEIFGSGVSSRIQSLYAQVLLHPDRKPRDHPLVESDVISEKSRRTEAHVAIRKIFSSKLETATMQDSPGVISIKAASPKGPSGARGRQPIGAGNGAYSKGKLGWEELGGEYLHFSLYKENKDTMEVLFYIASALKIPAKNFQFAGTKDRRAVTVQRVAIFRIYANTIAALNKSAKGWRAGNFEYKKHGLELGELGGNEFLLTLRDCRFAGDESLVYEQRLSLARTILESASKSFLSNGFINYYGLQRFGSFSTGTHATGQKMLCGDLEGAVESILAVPENIEATEQTSRNVPQDDIDRAQAIKLWREGRLQEASRKMPRRFQAEAAVIEYLGKRDKKSNQFLQDHDWQGALTRIPRNLRMMYVHAYQSFVWNTMSGKRWELFGDKVVEGDLVIIGEKDGSDGLKQDDVDEDGEPIVHPAVDDSAPSTENSFTRARHLSEEEAQSGKYDVFDVVLPLPGYDVLYPTNAIGKFYEEFMASDVGGGIDPHNMRRSWKDISLSGAYRKLMARPGPDFSFDLKSYVEDEEQLVETDRERLQKAERVDRDDTKTSDGSSEDVEKAEASVEKKIAIVLKLQLGSSQYATMALRELTKGGAGHFKPDFSISR